MWGPRTHLHGTAGPGSQGVRASGEEPRPRHREKGPAPSTGLVSRPGTHRPVTQTHLTWPNHSSHRNDLYFHKEVSPFFGSQWPPWSISVFTFVVEA